MSQPAKPSPLGRGLSALFGDADTSYQAPPKQSVARASPPHRHLLNKGIHTPCLCHGCNPG